MERAMTGAADVLRFEIENAPRHSLPEIGQRLWAAVADGTVTDSQAEHLDELLRARMAPATGGGSSLRQLVARPARPRPRESVERRRRWVAAGWLPPRLAQHFTSGETAALAVVASQVQKRGSCDLCHGAVAALAGVSVSTVKRAIRQARVLGLVQVRERRVSRFRSDSNVVTIRSSSWTGWLSLSRRRGGVQSRATTTTSSTGRGRHGPPEAPQEAIREGRRTSRGRSAAGRVRDS